MAATVLHRCRHPVKGRGEEAPEAAVLETGPHVPLDRVRASAREPAMAPAPGFVVQAMNAELARLGARLDGASGASGVTVPAILHRQRGHRDFGVCARVLGDGRVAVGDLAALA